MSHIEESPSLKDFRQALAEREEAIMYLASIIPKIDKDRIRVNIEKDPQYEKKHYLFGIKVKNVLRIGGFFYLPENMDAIWFNWLKEAVNLPEDKIILSNSIEKRIKKFRDACEPPPLCQELEQRQIDKIKRGLEDRYRIEMPYLEVKYSENVRGPFVLTPPSFDIDELDYVKSERDYRLKFRGLEEHEFRFIDSSKFTIFLPKRHYKCQVGLYADAWHELAHVAGRVIGVEHMVLSESFAYANEFRGLLEAVKEGFFKEEEVIDTIEFFLRRIEHEQFNAGFFSKLKEIGIKGIPGEYTTPYHYKSLDAIKKYNPNLRFRGRYLDELIDELDKSAQDTIKAWKKMKWESTIRPAIICVSLFVIVSIILIAIVLLSR